MQIRSLQRVAAPACLLAACAAPALAHAAADAALRPWPAARATPPLRLEAVGGGEWRLEQLRGKVVVLNFWASWCGPCVDELPVLNELARQDPARVAVVGINYREPLDSIERFTQTHPLAYPVLRDRGGEAFNRWTGGVMPTTVLVDRQGRARWRSVGALDATDARLRAALAALAAE